MRAALSILCLILLVGCEKPVESVDYSLLVHRDGITYMAHGTDPFTGDAIELHENGQLSYEATYKEGKIDGLQRAWYENGQLRKEAAWKEGELDGLVPMWYDNGRLEFEGTFKGGKQDGLLRHWDDAGQLVWEKTYKDGVLIG